MFGFGDIIRVSKPVTAFLGPQYRTSLDCIEIDITYRCNLRCYNCDRSCTQAPENLDMTLVQLGRFIEESKRKRWRRVRIVGGEPLLHPDIEEIFLILIEFKKENKNTLIEIVTNGYGDRVRNVMNKIPNAIFLKNTNKIGRFQRKFEAFNCAPKDYFASFFIDYSNACWITEECGLGLNPYGYYQCGVASSIDRVIGLDIGLKELPTNQLQLISLKKQLCPYCGHFFSRKFIPPEQRKPVNGEPKTKSWKTAYSQYERQKPQMTKY